jgi:hypothetical protein
MVSGARGGVESVRRIRTPHPNDILCGRGGSINNHPGNKTYRRWVHERKNQYNLAISKAEKARISREILNLVQALDPPGKFLTKDPDAAPLMGNVVWWVEIDDDKAMAKTSQALREGAPAIRATHKHEIDENQKRHSGSSRKTSSRKAPPAEAASMPPPPDSLSSDDLAIEALRTAAEAAKHGMGQGEHVAPILPNEMFEQSYERPTKMSRIDSTPTPPPEETPPFMPVVFGEQPKSFVSLSIANSMKRAHSLSLSEVESGDLEEEFVNPFEDESDYTSGNNFKHQVPSLARSATDSTNSIGNASFGSLLKSSSEYANHYQQRNGNNNGTPDIRKNISSRSVSVDDTSSFSLFKNCFCECGSPLEEGKVCPCSALADHLAWRDDHIEMDDWLHISGFYDQIVPCDQSRPVSP